MRTLAALAASVLMLAGCSSLHPIIADDRVNFTADELAGTWRDDGSGGVISFASGGTFVATNLPYEMFDDFSNVLPPGFQSGRDTLPGSGRWELKAPAVDPDGPRNHVYLHVQTLSNREVSTGGDLRVERVEKEVVLAFYVGDPDMKDRIVYMKCSNGGSETPSPSC